MDSNRFKFNLNKSFIIKVPSLISATSDDVDETQGYLLKEIIEYSSENNDNANEALVCWLNCRIQNSSVNVKIKTVKLMKHLSMSGHPSFKDVLRSHTDQITEVSNCYPPISVGLHSSHSTNLYSLLRCLSKNLLSEIFAIEPKDNGLNKSELKMEGFGNQNFTGMSGFGNSTLSSDKSIYDYISNIGEKFSDLAILSTSLSSQSFSYSSSSFLFSSPTLTISNYFTKPLKKDLTDSTTFLVEKNKKKEKNENYKKEHEEKKIQKEVRNLRIENLVEYFISEATLNHQSINKLSQETAFKLKDRNSEEVMRVFGNFASLDASRVKLKLFLLESIIRLGFLNEKDFQILIYSLSCLLEDFSNEKEIKNNTNNDRKNFNFDLNKEIFNKTLKILLIIKYLSSVEDGQKRGF